MGVVIITIPGEAKRVFANSLHKLTGEKVDLVVIQKRDPNHSSIIQRLKRLYKRVGLISLPKEVLYAVLLRLNDSAKKVLEYFRERSGGHTSEFGYLPKTMYVSSVNDTEVHKTLEKLSPDLIVIWGSSIIKPEIIKTGKRAINLHMGLCPYYRGAIANQYAVIKGNADRIGATIHYAEEKVDSGNILAKIKADISKPPIELFRELNDKAEEVYLDIAHKLFMGVSIPEEPQDITESENFLLKHWTPSTRYKLAMQILDWEKTGSLQKFDYRL